MAQPEKAPPGTLPPAPSPPGASAVPAELAPAPSPAPAPDPPPPASRAAAPKAKAPRPAFHASEILLQLVIVTAGVLIALLLDGLVQWSRDRNLAAEARANLQQEIRDNMGRLDRFFEEGKAFSQQRRDLRAMIDTLLAGKKTESDATFELNYKLVQLTSAAWETARETGALGHLPYREVKGYAQLYALQAEFENVQTDFLREFGRATMHGQQPDEMTPAELQTWRQHLSAAEGSMRLQQGLARALRDGAYPPMLDPPATPAEK